MPLDVAPETVAVGAAFSVVAAILSLVVAARWRRAWERAVRVRRAVEAGRAERQAEGLLRRRGYRVVDRQVRRRWPVRVGGRRDDVELRADLVVRRGGRRFIAEVKRGDLVASAGHGPTRRQLLEYLLAFRTDGVLLVDAGAGTVDEVRFPGLGVAPTPRGRRVLLVVALAIVGTGALLTVPPPSPSPRGGGGAEGLTWRGASGGCVGASARPSDR